MMRFALGFMTATAMMNSNDGMLSRVRGPAMVTSTLASPRRALGQIPDPGEMARAAAIGVETFMSLGSTLQKAFR